VYARILARVCMCESMFHALVAGGVVGGVSHVCAVLCTINTSAILPSAVGPPSAEKKWWRWCMSCICLRVFGSPRTSKNL
jgi:hypothetical protein